jgi:hypothetical protein
MKNKIDDLRNHLFAALEGLSDTDKPMEIERAQAIADVAQTVINTAKVEVEYMKATGKITASDFIQALEHTDQPKRLTAIGRHA